jgi:hypothetical protein
MARSSTKESLGFGRTTVVPELVDYDKDGDLYPLRRSSQAAAVPERRDRLHPRGQADDDRQSGPARPAPSPTTTWTAPTTPSSAQFPHTTWLLLKGSTAGFTDATAAAGLNLTGANSGTWGDYDNDGDLDLFITEWRRFCCVKPFRLMENLGNGTFAERTSQAGLTQSAGIAGLWGDFNNDGWLDLFVVNDETTTASTARPALSERQRQAVHSGRAAAACETFGGFCDSAAGRLIDGDLDILVERLRRPRLPAGRFRPLRTRQALSEPGTPMVVQARLVSNDTLQLGASSGRRPTGTQYRGCPTAWSPSQNDRSTSALGHMTDRYPRIVWPG